MSSTLTWLAHSETERQQALDVIDLFRERDTVDELGIGRIRDTFADLLFPGTTTIQTRAAYFLFVPWAYLRLERLRVPSEKIEYRARREEVGLIDPLKNSVDPDGTIGGRVGARVKRLPSSVYWGGLGTWKIRLFPGSRWEYHQSLDAYYRALDRWEAQEGDPSEPRPSNWHSALPEPPADLPEGASFRLRPEDAVYLQERILAAVPESLLAHLVAESTLFEEKDAVWELEFGPALLRHLKDLLTHARNFSEVIHGAPLLYNLMVGERAQREGITVEVEGQSPVERYRELLAGWTDQLASRREDLEGWDRRAFWRTIDETDARVPLPSQRFVQSWLELALEDPGPRKIAESQVARSLIRDRERRLKGGRARLHSRRALEMWSGESGVARLDYRWGTVQTLILDILRGLEPSESDA